MRPYALLTCPAIRSTPHPLPSAHGSSGRHSLLFWHSVPRISNEQSSSVFRCDGTQVGSHCAVAQDLSGESHRNRTTLYATNHGGRESIEAFDIDGRGATPSATWVGCVLMPDKLAANSVAAFGDGALVSTVVSLPGKTSPDGRNTGAVFMWTPGESLFHRLDGTELPVNNGIETSADDREFFVASMGLRQIVAFSRADPSKPIGFAQLTGFTPDNVRMVGTRLVAAGMAIADPSCVAGTPCPRGFAAQAIDPKTLIVSDLARFPATPPYSGTATAIPIDGEIWLSSFNGDRVAYGPIPR
jgi:hypothetical protein